MVKARARAWRLRMYRWSKTGSAALRQLTLAMSTCDVVSSYRMDITMDRYQQHAASSPARRPSAKVERAIRCYITYIMPNTPDTAISLHGQRSFRRSPLAWPSPVPRWPSATLRTAASASRAAIIIYSSFIISFSCRRSRCSVLALGVNILCISC